MDRVANFADESSTNKVLPDDLEYVYFDFETTGLDIKTVEICQIAAKVGVAEVQAFIMPINGIPYDITRITQLSIQENTMYYKNDPVEIISLSEALLAIIEFLRKVKKPVILIAHNGFRFDVPLLIRDIQAVGLWAEFNENVYGFVDTLHLLPKMMPERVEKKLKFNQRALTRDLLGPQFDKEAHNALNDVTNLQEIINKIPVCNADLRAHIKSVTSMITDLEMPTRKKSLQCLQGFIMEGMMYKIARAGISLHDLQHAFREKKEEGVELLLREDVGGRPRVTNTKKIITQTTLGIQKSMENEM